MKSITRKQKKYLINCKKEVKELETKLWVFEIDMNLKGCNQHNNTIRARQVQQCRNLVGMMSDLALANLNTDSSVIFDIADSTYLVEKVKRCYTNIKYFLSKVTIKCDLMFEIERVNDALTFAYYDVVNMPNDYASWAHIINSDILNGI